MPKMLWVHVDGILNRIPQRAGAMNGEIAAQPTTVPPNMATGQATSGVSGFPVPLCPSVPLSLCISFPLRAFLPTPFIPDTPRA